ncbi:hypothetical protein FHS83_000204 [Rhizomicrobium palustre]|uniref:Uncharacterized protein n=1 Tax=Rhizomicrobium palustre TaxID=189966 RepID=A0A846MU61_9PROT|nr:hypothetical protein [Rhizomicrobium palustre]NIK86886.1 hypothetical protein [Rhizomicrobium palustre]
MGTLWVVAPLVVAGLGFIGFLFGAGHLVRGRFMRAGAGLGGGGLITIAGLAVGLIGLNLQSYQRLTYEVPLAQVSVHVVNPALKIYTVAVTRLDGTNRVQNCTLQGDSWEVGGRFQKWKPWANEIGLDATYTLDQITNRYNSAAEGNGKRITACDLQSQPSEVSKVLPRVVSNWILAHMMVKQREFGSASYMPLVDGAKYTVIATQFGFNAEPANAIANRANERVGF